MSDQQLGSLLPTHSAPSRTGSPRQRSPFSLFIFPLFVLCSFVFFEFFLTDRYISSCQWPLPPSSSHNILIVSDPQLTDDISYPKRPKFLQPAVEWLSDSYMKTCFASALKHLQPHSVLFLGDLMDGGREWSDSKFLEEKERFDEVFMVSHPQTANLTYYYVPGNHDVGIRPLLVDRTDRFSLYFDLVNQLVSIDGHQMVFLNTLSLDQTFPNPVLAAEAKNLVKQVAAGPAGRSRVLVTHLPLYRPITATCGIHRRSNPQIKQGVGNQYRNLNYPADTEWILSSLQPDLVLSGDDHDICEVEHEIETSGKKVTEWTVGTFSFTQGNHYPSFGLLSLLVHPAQEETGLTNPKVAYTFCRQPPRLFVLLFYVAILVVTLVVYVLPPNPLTSFVKRMALRFTPFAPQRESTKDS
eukprot:TRINITY_DN6488_c0_g1_i2.p1 TRINITY_DN6488_c0_g1~~TRINITY_DN6488_c0_g1_i2.p1  ORF type:complete len:412 (-),score=52.68 TRINITY_DN6488_c0_g1_i2:225-1460(-)